MTVSPGCALATARVMVLSLGTVRVNCGPVEACLQRRHTAAEHPNAWAQCCSSALGICDSLNNRRPGTPMQQRCPGGRRLTGSCVKAIWKTQLHHDVLQGRVWETVNGGIAVGGLLLSFLPQRVRPAAFCVGLASTQIGSDPLAVCRRHRSCNSQARLARFLYSVSVGLQRIAIQLVRQCRNNSLPRIPLPYTLAFDTEINGYTGQEA